MTLCISADTDLTIYVAGMPQTAIKIESFNCEADLYTYVHRIHLFVLRSISPRLFKIVKFCKLQYIPYEMLHK